MRNLNFAKQKNTVEFVRNDFKRDHNLNENVVIKLGGNKKLLEKLY